MSVVLENMSSPCHSVVVVLQELWPLLVIDEAWGVGRGKLRIENVCPSSFGVYNHALFRLNMSEDGFWDMVLSGGYNRFGLDALACFLQSTIVPDRLSSLVLFFGGVRLIEPRTGTKFAVYVERVRNPVSELFVWQLGVHATTDGNWFRPGSCMVAMSDRPNGL